MTTSLRSERGIALVLSLFLMMAMSVVAASLMFMSQTETYSSMNYRLMSQSRYAAEAGIQKAANFFLWGYTTPTPGGADAIGAYTYTGVSPVQYNGQPVVLSANPGVASNYPVAGVQAAFLNAVSGSLAMGGTSVSYQPYATLMSMQQVNTYGGGTATLQTWLITSDGTVTAGRTSKIEVTAMIETQAVPATGYAAFSTNGGCGSMTFSGSSVTESYDSSTYNGVGGITAANGGLAASGGNVGTNGNLGESGNATIDGSLSTPRVGVGNCSAGNVDAMSSSGHASITGGVVQLPQTQAYPPPTAPNPAPPTSNLTINSSSSCASLGLSAPATCSGAGGTLTINPNGSTVSLGNITVSGGGNLTLAGGTYNINSIAFTGNSTMAISPGTGAVIMNVAGSGQATPIDFTGGSFSNSSFNPAEFQIQYAGTGNIVLTGNSTAAAMVYAPNASGTLTGNDSFYGSIITSTLSVTGNASIYYDRHLSTTFFTVGNTMVSSFSWKRF